MAKPANRILDVWIVETKAVYTDVPFSVVVDWIQQGRLLGDDRVRISGNEKWHPISKVPALGAYLPRAEPLETPAAAEALEPVDLGWHWKHPGEEEDEDVDMIPLIDISLVLLIFFMMTATVSSGFLSNIQTPPANRLGSAPGTNQFWIGVEPKAGGDIVYSLGRENDELSPATANFADFRGTLTKQFIEETGEVKIRIRADKSLPVDTVTNLIRELRELQARLNGERQADRKVTLTVLGEVSEAK
jgi:biopolymer transport protein ExbD